MTEEQRQKLEELKWALERTTKQRQLSQKLEVRLLSTSYSFVPDDRSDLMMQATHSWPSDKWAQKLYLQVPIDQPEPITKVLNNFIRIAPGPAIYLFFMHYNFGLVQMDKATVLSNWQYLIDIDGDEVFCYLPGRPEFICIEKTEDFIIGQEEAGMKWIYEVTFSSPEVKTELIANGT